MKRRKRLLRLWLGVPTPEDLKPVVRPLPLKKRVDALAKLLERLEEELDGKADKDDLEELKNELEDKASSDDLSEKADQSELDDLISRVDELEE